MLLAQVRKPPDVTQSHTETKDSQEEMGGTLPLLPILTAVFDFQHFRGFVEVLPCSIRISSIAILDLLPIHSLVGHAGH